MKPWKISWLKSLIETINVHTLVVGVTRAGKTTLLKKIAKQHVKNGYTVLVLTAVYEPWGDGVMVFDNQDEFLKVFWSSQKCIVIIDEGMETMGRYNEAMAATTTRGGHWGHSVYVAGQSATQINPTVRGQCAQLYCFAQGTKASETLAEEYRQPILATEAPELKRGEFFLVRRFGDDGGKYIKKLNAFEFSEG